MFYMRYIVALICTIGLDQVVKILVRNGIAEGESIDILGNLFRLTHVENPGVAFGLMPGAGLVLKVIPLLIVIAVIAYIIRDRGRDVPTDMVLTVIAAGGLGNLIDRFMYGTVTDMFKISFFPPVFNVADIAVTVGCGILILMLLLGDSDALGKEAE